MSKRVVSTKLETVQALTHQTTQELLTQATYEFPSGGSGTGAMALLVEAWFTLHQQFPRNLYDCIRPIWKDAK